MRRASRSSAWRTMRPRRTCAAPRAIREALGSNAVNGWSELGCDTRAPGILGDAGDISAENSADMRARVESDLGSLLIGDTHPLVLGGDHSITYPVLRAMHTRFPRLSILHLDAHTDLYDAYEGDRYSH